VPADEDHPLQVRHTMPRCLSAPTAQLMHSPTTREATILPPLSRAHWPPDAYRRTELPERVLQFGTGMLLRSLCAASVDAANRAGAFNGRIVVVQSTPQGNAHAMNAQGGLFTLVERGLDGGQPVERSRLIGAISRALVAETEWDAVRHVVAQPELQVIVSNVTEAGFQIDAGFPARLTDALHARFERLRDGPPLFVIPTELVPDNGPRLAAMVDELAGRNGHADEFRRWLSAHVRFCSSLVDRITTGTPPADQRGALEAGLGYADALLTVTEPYHLWAIEGDPRALKATFPIDGCPEEVVFAPDIGFYEERKLRLLNATHTAMAPLATLAGVRTVREAVDHPRLGAFLRRLLFDEIIPATDLPPEAAETFARSVVERFRNPWLDHEWRVILTNQETKMRIRVVPLIGAFVKRAGRERAPEGIALACAAHLALLQLPIDVLAEAARVPTFVAAVNRWLLALERDGVASVLAHD
jgi:tagaturonate reductase